MRKLYTVLNLDFIYEETEAMYSKMGHPSVDPVVLVRFLLIGYLFGIPSERQISGVFKRTSPCVGILA